VVLGRVEVVEQDAVRIALAPGVVVRVRRAEITGNDLDLLSDLFTPGEVVAARRVPAPLDGLALRLDDVDETEDEPVPAIALLDDGPPWLELLPPLPIEPSETPRLPRVEPVVTLRPPLVELVETSRLPLVELVDTIRPPRVEPVETSDPSLVELVETPPTPADLFGPRQTEPVRERPTPGTGPVPTPPGGQRAPTPGDVAAWHAGGHDALPSPASAESPAEPPGKAARDLSLSLDAARAQVSALGKELLDDKVKRRQVELEVDRLLGRVGELTERLERSERRAEQQATALRKARQEAARLRRRLGDAGVEVPEDRHFVDDEEQLRFEVLSEWARAIPAAEKAGRPLAEYALGSRFLASLTDVEGVSRDRVVWTLVMVLTGLAPGMNGLQVHRLRTGAGGDDPARHRDDGAVCWRVSLQVNTPSARRLHYWKLPGGSYELSRVVLHDDVEP
jgi:hypothetical protein